MKLYCGKCGSDRLVRGLDWIACLRCGSEDIRDQDEELAGRGLFQFENKAERRPLATAAANIEAASDHIRRRYQEQPPLDNGDGDTFGVGWPD